MCVYMYICWEPACGQSYCALKRSWLYASAHVKRHSWPCVRLNETHIYLNRLEFACGLFVFHKKMWFQVYKFVHMHYVCVYMRVCFYVVCTSSCVQVHAP